MNQRFQLLLTTYQSITLSITHTATGKTFHNKRSAMKRSMPGIKEEFLNLIGEISVEELISNIEIQHVIEDIHQELIDVSIITNKSKHRGCYEV